MKTFKTILATLLLSVSVTAMAEPIANVEMKNHRINLYNESGVMFKSISDINGEVVGYSENFFITQKGNWIYLYNHEGKMYKTMSASLSGNVENVGNMTFSTKKGNVTSVYSMEGNLIYTIEKTETSNKIKI